MRQNWKLKERDKTRRIKTIENMEKKEKTKI